MYVNKIYLICLKIALLNLIIIYKKKTNKIPSNKIYNNLYNRTELLIHNNELIDTFVRERYITIV